MAHQNETPATGHKVWFITGTSRGFGRVWAEAALKWNAGLIVSPHVDIPFKDIFFKPVLYFTLRKSYVHTVKTLDRNVYIGRVN